MSGRLIVLTLVSTFGAAGVLTARADLPPSLPPLVTPETQDAIDLGLEYLARMQSRDGAWRHSGSWGGRYPTAMTALSGLTMLANGNTATQGKYAQNVSRAANFLLASAQPSGLIAREEESGSSMHGHGFAMLFLGQLCGMEEDNEKQERIAAVLRRAVELTARSQSRRGGWIYRPDSSDDEGSVTVTQLQPQRRYHRAQTGDRSSHEVPRHVDASGRRHLLPRRSSGRKPSADHRCGRGMLVQRGPLRLPVGG